MSKLETNTIDTVSGTNTLQVGDGNVATINLGKSGDTINVPSGATLNVAGTVGTGLTNTPAFRAYTDTIQTTSDGTATKAALNLETYDTNSCYDTSNYRFTPNVAGKYYFNWVAQDNYTSSAATSVQIYIRKNGSDIAESVDNTRSTNNHETHTVSTTVDMNGSSDYVEFFLYYSGGSGVIWRNNSDRQFAEGYRLIT